MLNNLIRFVENTKAKASEVNYNFDQVKQAVTELEDWKKDTEEKLNYSFFQIFDRVIKDHVLTGEEAKGLLLQGSLVTKFYPDAVAKIKEAREAAVDTEFTYGDITFPYKLAANRWCIVDLQYKDKVDELFNTTGIAEFYIWDNENEQFYLPRNKWFDQYTDDTSKVNNYNEAGLPDHNHKVASQRKVYAQGGANYAVHGDGTLLTTTYASASNPIYGKSNTVQPPSSNKLLYYVVGNTYVNQEDIDIAQVESELNNKASINADNFSNIGKSAVRSWGIPDYSKAATITFTQGQTYTIPYDCEIAFAQGVDTPGGIVSFKLNDNNGPQIYYVGSSTSNVVSSDRIRLLKGTKIYIWRYNLGGGWIYNFIAPLIGAEQ